MRLSEFISFLKAHPDYKDIIVHHQYIRPVEPRYENGLKISPPLKSIIGSQSIHQLYSHQARALELLGQGKNVVVATPTASGKSLIYNIAVLERLIRDPNARALYLFPLKALEQDQMKNLKTWLNSLPHSEITAEVYDGDTTPYMRKKIRANIPHIVFTNPDMLHRAILAYHNKWEVFLRNLNYVILDEIHTYKGVFGSHVNQILKRLKRISSKYGASPQFILLSATINNPGQFARLLIDEPVAVVDETGSPRAGQHFLFLNPHLSPNFSAARLFLKCLSKGFRTIAFTQSRKVTELIHLWVSQLSPKLSTKISSYRAGFMASERRDIEKRLATGQLLGVVSTSALEMGIDIGYLDICLLVGYPGSIINTWQRGGRVGRSGQESLIMLIAKPDALDQYFMRHPEDFFGRNYEAAVLDPDNPHVVKAHLPCAASEAPIDLTDTKFWPQAFMQHLEELEREGSLARTAEGEPVWFSTKRNPHLSVDIRAAGDTYTIFEMETGQAIGTVDGIRAFKECHPGAVYLHMARQYQVAQLMLDTKDIVVKKAKLNYFTRALTEKETEIIQVTNTKPQDQFLAREGKLKVTERVTGYEKRALPGQELLGTFSLDLPPQIFETTGFWIEIEPEIKDFVDRKGLHFMGGIHAIEHAAIGIFPLFALCDRNDVGGISYPYHPQLEKGAVFIYDGYPGGVGLSQRGFEIVHDLLEKTLQVVETCECEQGCPSCIHSPKCGSGNKPLDKDAAILILQVLLGRIPFSQIKRVDSTPSSKKSSFTGPEAKISKSARILFLDLETQKSAQEVGGWHNSHLMRISVAVVYDSAQEEFMVFTEKEISNLIACLEKADLVVGFNIKRFDYKVLSAYTPRNLLSLPTFDILEDLYSRLGFRLSLDHLAEETLGRKKLAHGLQAIEWFRQGEIEKLVEYCREDVSITKDIFEFGIRNKCLMYRERRNGTKMRILVDWDPGEIMAGKSNLRPN